MATKVVTTKKQQENEIRKIQVTNKKNLQNWSRNNHQNNDNDAFDQKGNRQINS